MTLAPNWGEQLADMREALALAEQARDAALSARDGMVRDLRDAGFSQAETAAFLGISNQRVSQIERAGWKGAPSSTPADRLAVAREAFQVAKHAQKLREERYAMGYKRETAIFYGDKDTPVSDDQEDRVRWAGFYEGKAS